MTLPTFASLSPIYLSQYLLLLSSSSLYTQALPSSSSHLMLTTVPYLQPSKEWNCLPSPPSSVTDRMAMPVLIRACMARCSARLSRDLWERELLILASGDGLKTTGAKTSKHSLITFAHWTHPHMHSSTQVSMSQQSAREKNRCMLKYSVKSHVIISFPNAFFYWILRIIKWFTTMLRQSWTQWRAQLTLRCVWKAL